MNCRSKTRDVSCVVRSSLRNTQYPCCCRGRPAPVKTGAIRNTKQNAFSLIEVMTALAILAIVSSSVLVVIIRCLASAADSALRMQAFEVARENMEKLLASSSLEQSVEYGESEVYPGIIWETVVETFYEPITARMWVRGVCSAQYGDAQGQEQTVELTHWLTDLTKGQLLQIMRDEQHETDQLASELIETVEEAAEYAGVDAETIEQWVENDLATTEDGSFVKSNLDLYRLNDGNPSAEEKKLQIRSLVGLRIATGRGRIVDQAGDIDPKTGLTYEELDEMDISEIWELLESRQR